MNYLTNGNTRDARTSSAPEGKPSGGLVVRRVERGGNEVSASFAFGGEENHARFAASEGIGDEPDFLLPAAMIPAMRLGAPLSLPEGVSPRLLSAVPGIQACFDLWEEAGFQRVPVDAAPRRAGVDRASGVACFFSGGVDSFYTLLKHRDDVTHLIFVHGFENTLTDFDADLTPRSQAASRMAREVAKELGKALIEVRTDYRSLPNVGSLDEHHGSLMASVALLFQHRFRRVLIPASFTFARLVPWGSHPVLDPMWSTELTYFEHDGCEAPRPEKTAYIAGNETVMRWLRVCNARDSAYNCGECEKCVRTMINLKTIGALERCETLPSDLSFEAVANLNLAKHTRRALALQNLKALERRGTEPKLAEALMEALEKHPEPSARAERRLAKLQARNERLAKRSKRLTRHNRELTARYSARRYRLADTLVNGVLKVPGIGKLRRRIKSRRSAGK